MNTSTVEIQEVTACSVTTGDDVLSLELSDGRTVSAPLDWFPRLLHGTPEERNHWQLIGRGHGVHWPDLDEDISVEGVLLGRPSGESQSSFQKWLANRPATS
jgi:hypothetical protein